MDSESLSFPKFLLEVKRVDPVYKENRAKNHREWIVMIVYYLLWYKKLTRKSQSGMNSLVLKLWLLLTPQQVQENIEEI